MKGEEYKSLCIQTILRSDASQNLPYNKDDSLAIKQVENRISRQSTCRGLSHPNNEILLSFLTALNTRAFITELPRLEDWPTNSAVNSKSL